MVNLNENPRLNADVRVDPLEVGFDLRKHKIAVRVLPDVKSAQFERGGRIWRVEGTRDEIISALERAGYTVSDDGVAP